jgi:hypothetical protein
MVEHMVVMEFEACAKELARAANPTPAVTSATRALWRFRAEQLTEIHAVVESGAYFVDGYRSPTAWLADVTREGFGQCKGTLRLAERIVHMPPRTSIVRQRHALRNCLATADRLLGGAHRRCLRARRSNAPSLGDLATGCRPEIVARHVVDAR